MTRSPLSCRRPCRCEKPLGITHFPVKLDNFTNDLPGHVHRVQKSRPADRSRPARYWRNQDQLFSAAPPSQGLHTGLRRPWTCPRWRLPPMPRPQRRRQYQSATGLDELDPLSAFRHHVGLRIRTFLASSRQYTIYKLTLRPSACRLADYLCEIVQLACGDGVVMSTMERFPRIRSTF